MAQGDTVNKIAQGSCRSHPEDNFQIKAAWEEILGGARHPASGALRSVIDESWRRCLVGRVDPGRPQAPPQVSGSELEALRGRHERLISASAPFLVQSRAFLARTGTVMILCDPDGTILDVEGDQRLGELVERAGLTPGNNWTEASIGTNAIGTALAMGQAIQVHGAEHFCEPIQAWTCSATVIRDPVDAGIVGVLDISGLSRDYTQHSLPLVATTANSIENRLAQMELERRFRLLEASVERLAGAAGVMVFDVRGHLVRANERAAPALAALGVSLSAETRIPVGGAGPAPAAPGGLLPDWLLANRIEPLFRGSSLLGFVVSLPAPTFAATTAAAPRGAPAAGQEALLATMIDQSASLVSLKDLEGRYQFVNRRFEEVFGVKSADLLGRGDAQVFPPALAREMRTRDVAAMGRTARSETEEELDLGQRRLRLAVVRFPIFDAAGRVQALCTQATELAAPGARPLPPAAAEALERAGEGADGEGVMVTDGEGRILTVNAAFTAITGYSQQDVAGKLPRILQSGLHSREFYQRMWHSLAEQGRWQGEIQNRRKNGEIFPEWLTIYTVKGGNGEVQGYIAIFGDSSALHSSRQRLEFMATHDALTGLPNRRLLAERLADCLAEARRLPDSLAVLLIDLDNFKDINDALGHDQGDLLLRQVAERLRRCLCDAHTLARAGSDEFAAILRGRGIEDLRRLADHILEYLSASFCLRGEELFVAASIGISRCPGDGDSAASLLRNADTALHEAKQQGRNRYRFFAPEMQTQVHQRVTLEAGLRAAIDQDRFRMVYQPQNALVGGRLVGAEALLRWHDPTLGDVSPARFIPTAEDAGLIIPISEMVLAKVLTQIALWRRQGLTPPRISINVAAQQLGEPGFVDHIVELLESREIPPQAICLELTEGTLMADLEGAAHMLDRLRQRGIAVSIDDFGTGHSSLAYLSRLPIQELKVDQSFVQGIAGEATKRSIISAIVDMAHALGMEVLAEGIETETQLDFLRERHCEMGQGYLFHRPLSAEAFEQLFAPARAPAPPVPQPGG